MQRRATKQSRGANQKERDFVGQVKELPCSCCSSPGPSIADHIYGSAKKLYDGLARVHVGHYAVIPLCLECDSLKTRGSRRKFEEINGQQEILWLSMISKYEMEVPSDVVRAIRGELSELTQTQIDTASQYITTVGSKSF